WEGIKMFLCNTFFALTVLVSSVAPVLSTTKAVQDEFNCKISGTTMTPEKRKLSMYLANAYRTIATTGVFGYPPSQNMYQLNYSCTAEEYAMMVCNQQAQLSPAGKPSPIPIAAAFQLWWDNHDFGAFINSTAVYDPNFDYTVFSQLVSGYAVSIGCTDTCYGQKQVYCAFDVCTAMTYFGMIYEAGSGPCMVDSDCTTFSGSTCNTKNGLCVKNPNTPLCPPNV
uniref:SCP domain-containing protein n=2 Tax=Haemonchus contortus TaxID=6289 RepID=A0A7I4YX45_HAECO